MLAAAAGMAFAGTAAGWPSAAKADSTVALTSGGTLASGRSVTAPNSDDRLVMRASGNLAVVDAKGDDVFYTHTGGDPGAHATMKKGGNLVVETKSGVTVWQSHTAGYTGARLVWRNDGSIAVVAGGSTVWDTRWLQSVGGAEEYAKALFVHYGWSVSKQYPYLNDVWGKIESGWHWNICSGRGHYPSCDYQGIAYGIPQADPGSKMASANPDWATDGLSQVVWGLHYIQNTYGTPEKAYEHEEHSCSKPPCGYLA